MKKKQPSKTVVMPQPPKPEDMENTSYEIIHRWPNSRYEMLDGRAMEAQTLIDDAIKEIVGIYRILNRDVSYAVSSHEPLLSMARETREQLSLAIDKVAKLGSSLDWMAMVTSGKAQPKTGKQGRHAS